MRRDQVFDAEIGKNRAVGGLESRCEEELDFEDAARRLHVFAGGGAADGGFVQADGAGDVGHDQGFEVADAMVEKIALDPHDFGGDLVNGLLALSDAFHEEDARLDLLSDVFLDLRGGGGVIHEVPILPADPQVGQLIIVQGDHILAGDLVDDDFGGDIRGGLAAIGLAGAGVQGADQAGGPSDLLGIAFQGAGDLVEFLGGQGFEMTADDPGGEGVGQSEAVELDQQAFPQIPGADAGGIEILNDLQDGAEMIQIRGGRCGEFVQ